MNKMNLQINRGLRIWLIIAFACVLWPSLAAAQLPDVSAIRKQVGPKPGPAPARFRGLIGEYGTNDSRVIVLEKAGRLYALFGKDDYRALKETSRNIFEFQQTAPPAGQRAVFERDPRGRATRLIIRSDLSTTRAELSKDVLLSSNTFLRNNIEPETGNQLHVQPLRPVRELMKEALAAHPPPENGEFRKTDLVELAKLDPTIRLEIRYATTNNFLGTIFYSEARAFLQRPAAEAVVRASTKLHALGYGLLIHDAYRPWYVTKVFWDATPDDKKVFVADPSKGSRHNRGCAVDLTLYDLKTGKPIEMVSTYDETTSRAYPDYPGGTALQRWHRALLRAAMEAEGFTVYEAEWWHFDFKDWQKYRIGNLTFEQIK